MSNLSNSSAEPSYISRLALNATPFSATIDATSFYNGEQIEQRLNLLLHLVRSSDKVGLLFAQQGLGKTTLLAQVQQYAGNDLRICHIDAHSELDSSAFLAECLQAFGVENANITQINEHETLLKERLKRLQNLNITPLLLIDNVDTISADNLAIILDWLAWQDDDDFLLQAILTSSRIMPELDTIHGRLQRIDLPALAENEVDDYLMQRLEAVGFKGELPFNSKILKQFYKQSAGVPAIVNQLAHQTLLGIKTGSKSTLNMSVISTAFVFRWFGIAMLVLTLIVLLAFQDKINALFTQEASQIEELELPFTAEDESLATVVVGEETLISSEQAERDELAQLVAELPVEKEQAEDYLATIENVAIDSHILETKDLETDRVEKALEEDSIAVLTEDDLVSAKVESGTASPIHQQDWIKQQQATHYTFQLMGSWQHEQVTEFIEKYDLSGDVAEFQSDRNGRVWYALIFGVYDNKQDALQASNDWPTPLNTLPSWLRRFDSVQKQIRSTDQ